MALARLLYHMDIPKCEAAQQHSFQCYGNYFDGHLLLLYNGNYLILKIAFHFKANKMKGIYLLSLYLWAFFPVEVAIPIISHFPSHISCLWGTEKARYLKVQQNLSTASENRWMGTKPVSSCTVTATCPGIHSHAQGGTCCKHNVFVFRH